jgi:hypothetical protein
VAERVEARPRCPPECTRTGPNACFLMPLPGFRRRRRFFANPLYKKIWGGRRAGAPEFASFAAIGRRAGAPKGAAAPFATKKAPAVTPGHGAWAGGPLGAAGLGERGRHAGASYPTHARSERIPATPNFRKPLLKIWGENRRGGARHCTFAAHRPARERRAPKDGEDAMGDASKKPGRNRSP